MECANCGKNVDRLYQYDTPGTWDEDNADFQYNEWILYYFEERNPTDLASIQKYGKKCKYDTQTGVCKKCLFRSDFKNLIKNWIEIFVEKTRR